MSALVRCRVVLVRPHYAGNLGSVARVMANFGLNDLVLVDPIARPEAPEAVMMAVRAAPILAQARTFATLAEAVADCGWVLATSGEDRGLIRHGFTGPPEHQLATLLDRLADSTAAIVFGPEPSGLTRDDLAQCHAAAFIPATDDYPSLNLAQAVAVMLYELRKQQLAAGPQPAPDRLIQPATYQQLEIAFRRLREGLESVRFLWDHRADGIFHVLRQLIVRGRPTAKDLKVLHGLAGQLLHVATVYKITHPRDGRPPPLPPDIFPSTKSETSPKPAE